MGASQTRGIYGDIAISDPREDLYDIDGFCAMVAGCIANADRPIGTVFALTGRWGSGKTSAKNLVRHHLEAEPGERPLHTIEFKCWWYRGEEAITDAFLREVRVALAPTLGTRATNALWQLGKLVHRLRPLAALTFASSGNPEMGMVAFEALQATTNAVRDHQEDQSSRSADQLWSEVTKSLESSPTELLVVVDDIDRLTPEETRQLFRVIKSVGQLPNVKYLLIYDRPRTEQIFAELAEEGEPHYLEKIVQASFDLPEARTPDLRNAVLREIEEACGPITGEPAQHAMLQTIYSIVAHEIRTPRDVVRLGNAFRTTWPSIATEVNAPDYIALETYRVLQHGLYLATRRSPHLLCGTGDKEDRDSEQAQECERALLSSIGPGRHGHYKLALRHLFPRLDSVWGRLHHGAWEIDAWLKTRRACTERHFNTYFRFERDDATVSADESARLLASTSSRAELKALILAGLSVSTGAGPTRAALLLEELQLRADEIDEVHIEHVLAALFELGDDLDIKADRERGVWAMSSNWQRLRYLTRKLAFRIPESQPRTDMLIRAAENASLGWLLELGAITTHEWRAPDPDNRLPEHKRLTTEEGAALIQRKAMMQVQAAAADGSLNNCSSLSNALINWVALSRSPFTELRNWTSTQLMSDEWVSRLCEELTAETWHTELGFGDAPPQLSRRVLQPRISGIDSFLDVALLRKRLEEMEHGASPPEAAMLYLKLWRAHEDVSD